MRFKNPAQRKAVMAKLKDFQVRGSTQYSVPAIWLVKAKNQKEAIIKAKKKKPTDVDFTDLERDDFEKKRIDYAEEL